MSKIKAFNAIWSRYIQKNLPIILGGIALCFVVIIAVMVGVIGRVNTIAGVTAMDSMKAHMMQTMPATLQEDLANGDVSSTVDWAREMITSTLKEQGISVDSEKDVLIREKLNTKIEQLVADEKLEFDEDGNLTPLSKAYIVNEIASIMAETYPEMNEKEAVNNVNYVTASEYESVLKDLDIVKENLKSAGNAGAGVVDEDLTEQIVEKNLAKYYTAEDVDALIEAAKTSLLAELLLNEDDPNLMVNEDGTVSLVNDQSLNDTVADIETKVNEMSDDYGTQLAAALLTLDGLKEQVNDIDYSGDISDLNKKIKNLENQDIASLNDAITALENKDKSVETSYTQMNSSLTSLTSSFNALKEQVGDVKPSDVSSLSKKIDSVAATVSQNSASATSSLRTEYIGTTKATNETVAELTNLVTEYMNASDTRLKTDVLQDISVRRDGTGDYEWVADGNAYKVVIDSDYFINANSLNIAYQNANYNISPTYDMDVVNGSLTIRTGNPIDIVITSITVTHFSDDATIKVDNTTKNDENTTETTDAQAGAATAEATQTAPIETAPAEPIADEAAGEAPAEPVVDGENVDNAATDATANESNNG